MDPTYARVGGCTLLSVVQTYARFRRSTLLSFSVDVHGGPPDIC
jgi:hypothetical protein